MKFMGDKWTSMVHELSFEGLQKSWRALCFAGLSFQLEGPTLGRWGSSFLVFLAKNHDSS